jgi:hypothetical protein
MPRHRKQCVPQHRAQRREGRPGRGVPVSAASRPVAGRRLRGLLVTPWLAAGTGIVIAATMALAVPKHAILSYGPIDPGMLCKNPRCVPTVPGHGPGLLAGAKPGIQLLPPGIRHTPAMPAAAARPGATPLAAGRGAARTGSPAGVTIGYAVLSHGHGTFRSVITVQSREKLGAWSLGFAIPGARLSDVWGATWQPSASGDGGVASGRPWPWARSGPGTAKIVIFATGRPRAPVGCTFDGRACVFG